MSCSDCTSFATRSGRRWLGPLALILGALLLQAGPGGAAVLAGGSAAGATPAGLCAEAIHAAEITYRLPPGLLAAIGEVESGRVDAVTGRLEPWPWTIQAGAQSLAFDSKQQALQWVREATARGVTSIDAGCLQVNLFYHPHAFDTLDEAFEPRSNVDYAARFLLRLYGMTGDWRQATGFYHSQTSALAASYLSRVERRLSGLVPPLLQANLLQANLLRANLLRAKPPSRLVGLTAAWQATLPPALLLGPSGGGPAGGPGNGFGNGPGGGNDWGVLLHAAPAGRGHAKRMIADVTKYD